MSAAPQLDLPFGEPPAAEPGAVVVFIRHRRARRYRIRVDRDGAVRVTIPRGGTRRDAEAFLRRSGSWVARQRARIQAHALPPDEQARLRAVAVETLPPRLRELAAAFGLEVRRVSIRNPKARWGSCGHEGHISLNWRLVRMPPWVRDYVLVHELMHLREMNHSPRFWAHVAEACPEWREARRWLRDHGHELS